MQQSPGQWFNGESGLHQNWMRDYDPTTGRYLQADPLGLVDGASVYGYALQNPGRWVDPRGEELRLHFSPAFGVPGLNHVYLWSDECACGIGTAGSSSSSSAFGGGDGTYGSSYPGVRVSVPSGMSDREFVNQIRGYSGWNNGVYFPFVNDCHVDMRGAFRAAGYPYPPNPGRFNADGNLFDSVISDINAATNSISTGIGLMHQWLNWTYGPAH